MGSRRVGCDERHFEVSIATQGRSTTPRSMVLTADQVALAQLPQSSRIPRRYWARQQSEPFRGSYLDCWSLLRDRPKHWRVIRYGFSTRVSIFKSDSDYRHVF